MSSSSKTKLDRKLNSYAPLEPTDKTKEFLRDFFKTLPPDGKKIWRGTFQGVQTMRRFGNWSKASEMDY
ncbi:uncharacterized protein N7458_003253 [Penicillium daleae]|uniref:Uncharacterized protein n=1 Tax=Penicillium daleae TaxID=63821 RepID=A0AAD6CEB6_9EURO|nr:uncharacterized protein N7458_003253 [Penicillium daleae]KAJ5461701.1 hypothetical protein N7458_003253 [Penicillium daleae]